MPTVVFAPALQRHVICLPVDAPGTTVREALDYAFSGNARARGYILDEHAALRKHMIIFIDGERIQDRVTLSDTVGPASKIYVMQSLSGG